MNIILKQKKEASIKSLEVLTKVLVKLDGKMVDGSMLPEMAKISVNADVVNDITTALEKNWDLFPEKKYKVPSTRKKIETK